MQFFLLKLFSIFLALCFIAKKNIHGNDLTTPGCSTTTKSAMECHQLCKLTANCKAFTWVNKDTDVLGEAYDKKCCLKTQLKNLRPTNGAISGSNICGGKYFSVI